MKCERLAHADTKRTVENQWQTCKQLNALIAPTSPTSPTCRVDVEEKADMIERLEEVIHEDRKNEEALEQRLAELGKRLQVKDEHISRLEMELRSRQ